MGLLESGGPLGLVTMNSLASWGLSQVRLICSDVGGCFQGQPAGPLGEGDMGVWGIAKTPLLQ